jgi:hypothetical protein
MSKLTARLVALFCAGLLALAGCAGSPQTAAQVGDRRITESEIAPIAAALADASTDKTDTAASFNSTVLTLMIQSELAHSAIVAAGITIADADRKTLYASNEQLGKLATEPVTADFMQRYADLYLMAQTDAGTAAFAKAAQDTKVVVNPRYGTWDATQLQLTNVGGSLSESAPAKP